MISVSYLKSIYSKEETLKKLDNSLCDYIHMDLMDGLYVSNKNFNIDEVLNDFKDISKKLDIHLMVMNPIEYISNLAMLKPQRITIHLNTTTNLMDVIDLIKEYNIEVGIAINPNEDIHLIDNYLNKIDYCLIMSVIPGLGGQEFMPSILPKLDYLKDKNILIGVDGGINNDSIKYLKGYRVDNIISGSYVCMNEDFDKQINILKENIN